MIEIDEYKKLRACNHLIVLDTNIFLELYRQPASISIDVIETLKKVLDNLYIPRQVYDEYMKNYQAVCGDAKRKYQNFTKKLKESTRKFHEDVFAKTSDYRNHNYTDITQLEVDLGKTFADINRTIDEYEQNHKSEIKINKEFLESDKVKEFIDLLYENGKVGEAIPFSRRLSILQEGKIRFDNFIPPGYMDREKMGEEKYGDLFIWKSILDEAKKSNSHIIFVSNDVKKDWWEKERDTPINLRKELRDEFKEINPILEVNFLTLDKMFYYLSEELHMHNSLSALKLSAMDVARKFLEQYEEKIYDEIGSFLTTMDIKSEIGEEYISAGDEKIYWKIESVSVDKENKTISYYINLNISVIVDLSYEVQKRCPYNAGKGVIDILGKFIISKEDYDTSTYLEESDICLVNALHIEPEIWNIINNEGEVDSAKNIIDAYSAILEYKRCSLGLKESLVNTEKIYESEEPLIKLAKEIKSLSALCKHPTELQNMANEMKSLSALCKQPIGEKL